MDDHERATDLVGQVQAELAKASATEDEVRLKTLDDLYRSLEGELERDLDQAGSARR